MRNGAPSKKGFEGRIWEKISPEPNSGCWLWTGSGTLQGYGSTFFEGKKELAHRAVYEYYSGRIPAGMVLDHLCRVPCCVNPAHLEPVTHGENLRRGLNGPKTYCKRGHLFDEQNTDIRKNGTKACKRCMSDLQVRRSQIPELREHRRLYMREYQRKRREAKATS